MNVQKGTACYAVQNGTARPLRRIQNGKSQVRMGGIGGGSGRLGHSYFGTVPGFSAHDTVDVDGEPKSFNKWEWS